VNSGTLNKPMPLKIRIPIGLMGVFLFLPFKAQAGFFDFEPWRYSAEPIEGRVIDHETGKPIEGANIVAQWVLAGGWEGHEVDRFVVIEAVTGADGRYRIPGWGPKWRPWFRWLENADPEILVFKPGYWPRREQNQAHGSASREGINPLGAKVRKSYWNGKDIELWPFKMGETIESQRMSEGGPYPDGTIMTEKEWAKIISLVQGSVNWTLMHFEGTEEDWFKIQNLIKTLQEECLRLPRKYHGGYIHLLPSEYRSKLLGREAEPCL
jgi:hypothetical protein